MPDRGWRVAWVHTDAERDLREREVRSLQGRSITKVSYFGLNYEGAHAPSWHADGFDALDFGLELDLDDGSTVSMTWKVADHNEALLVVPGRLEGQELVRGSAASADVSEHWFRNGPAHLASLAFGWMHWEGTDLCLQTVLIHDDQRQAVITLGDADAACRYTPSATNLAVFFSTAAAEAAGVCMPPSPGTSSSSSGSP